MSFIDKWPKLRNQENKCWYNLYTIVVPRLGPHGHTWNGKHACFNIILKPGMHIYMAIPIYGFAGLYSQTYTCI